MSASQTDIDKQVSRHRGPLVGIAFALFSAGVFAVGVFMLSSAQGDKPTETTPSAYAAD